MVSALEIEHCPFPDHLRYDQENNTWVAGGDDGSVTVGITSLLSAVAGKFNQARFRPVGTRVERGRSLGTLESASFVGPVPSPVSGTITAVNEDAVRKPKLLNDSPYHAGWVAKLKPSSFLVEKILLSRLSEVEELFRQKIIIARIRCFKAFPDYEMLEIGTECSAALVHLTDLLKTVATGETVHLVTDDPTSYVEMVRWTEQTHQELVDWRKEENIFHFILRKEV